MSQDKLTGAIKSGREALEKLEEAISALQESSVSKEHKNLFHDALAKRFESAFEYCWRMLKAASEYQGSEAAGPRPAILEAVRYGWIEDPEWWALCLDIRNESVHDYFGTSQEHFEEVVFRFAKELEALIERVSAEFELS